jgi:CheY-like chemotaxis protein
MPVVLICAATPLEGELSNTLLWRGDVVRHIASRLDEALRLATSTQPTLIVIDRRFPRLVEIVTALRRDERTRGCSIVILARGDFDSADVEVLEAGANAILRFPPDAEWEERLDRLLSVPARRETRFSVQLEVGAEHSGESMVGEAVNLSAHGMLLQVSVPLGIGDTVSFAFRLPTASVQGQGTVVRLAGANRYGLFFERLERDGREQIERYVTTLR